MTHSTLKRALSALMVALMLIGVLPVNVFAGRVVGGGNNGMPVKPIVNDITPDIELGDDISPEVEIGVDGTSEVAKIAEKMEDIYIKYIGETRLTTEEIEAKVAKMDYDTLQALRLENYYLEELASSLNEEEITAFNECFTPYIDLASAAETRGTSRQMARTSQQIVTGLTFADSANSSSYSGGTYTANAKGSLFSKKTNTITITNGTDAKMKLAFSYTISNQNSYGGLFTSASGNVEIVLEAGASTTASIQSKSGLSAGTATVTITNIVFAQILESADVTMNFNSALGSVTVNGAAVTPGQTMADLSTSSATTFVATPVSGASFVGWVDGNGMLIGTSANYSTTLAGNITMKAVFASTASAPVWYVGGYIYEDFATAASKGGTMALASNGTLPAGEYTVPANTTLLIPNNAAYTLYTTRPGYITVSSADTAELPTVSVFRTLYMASGANITVNGAISIAGSQQPGAHVAGAPRGPLGYINMSQNSNITINNGAKLYAWGFITGSGNVLAKSGATVYEDFAVVGWRGGSMTSDMVGNDQGVFIFNSYFIQNVEVPLTYESGAKEMGVMSVNISVIGIQDAEVPFIGQSKCMFNVKSGKAVKAYDGATDRLSVTVDGNLSVDTMSISMKLGLLGTKNVNTAEYLLPITFNLSAIVNSGTLNINQDIALLPGSEIVVGEGAHCILGSGNSVIVYDVDEWGLYDTQFNRLFDVFPPNCAPGQKYTRTEKDIIDARVKVNGTVDASQGYLYSTPGGGNVYSTGNGKIYTGKSGTKAVTYQITQNSNQNITYIEIPVVPALLRNADDSTISVKGEKNRYTYADGKWAPCAHNMVAEGYKAPTCTETGLTNREYCSICNIEYVAQTTIAATGHTEVVDAAVAATCTETGLTEGKHCSVCTTVIIAQTVVDALGHTEVVDAAVAATCTETGLTEGKHCSVCNTVIIAQETVAALGHTEVVDEAVAPTCTETGLTEGSHCSRCSEVFVAQTVINALGHTEVVDEAVAPTCTETGLTEGTHCSVCNGVVTAQEVVAALGHTEAIDAAVAATCTTTGLTEGKHCSVCNAIIVEQTVVEVIGHSYVGSVTTDPTCTAEGVETFTCENCGDSYTVPVASLGHDMIIEAAVEPTCTQVGVKAGSHCSRCDYKEGMGTIPALGHDEVTDAAVAPTCTETGLTEGSHCARCSVVLTEQTVVEALGHNEVTDEAVAPTCTATGLTEGSHCSRCDKVFVEQETVAALGHTEVADAAVAPTCAETGLTEGTHCSVCNEVVTAQEVVPAIGHAWDDGVITTAATCVKTGIKTYTCSNDATHTYTEDVPAIGHAWDDGVVTTDPTCTVEGIKTFTCTNDPSHTRFESVEATGHTAAIDAAVAPTCTATGLTEGTHCSVCTTVLTAQEVVAALGHEMAEATCTAPKTCTRNCGYTEGEALGHKMADATCTLPATCTVCGYTDGDALGHTEEYYEEEPAFCEQQGYTEGAICSVCGKILYGREVIPALEHDIVEVEAKKPTYSSVGWEAYEKCTRCAYSTCVIIPKLDEPTITSYEELLENLVLLEELANEYVIVNPGKDPLSLVIKYIRTGVESYTTGSWGIMAGYEDKGFAQFVADSEDAINAEAPTEEYMIKVSALKNIENFYLPNGDYADLGHLFGTMDITYTNKSSQNHADVAGWSGDLVDLLVASDHLGVSGNTIDEKATYIKNNYLGVDFETLNSFGIQDIQSDLDAIYIMKAIYAANYEVGTLTQIFTDYFTADLNDVDRADYFLDNRLDGVSTRGDVRDAVYNAYIKNNVVTTLEGTEEIRTDDVVSLRKAVCYAFADYVCQLAGDYVEETKNSYYEVFSSETSNLAPGITQKINYATSADGKQMVYYLATGDITRGDVHVFANYNDTYPEHGWAMARVLDQANAAQERYGNPESPDYIENYNVIASTNGAAFNMQTGEPSGLLVMNGVQYQDCNNNGFFGILKDGSAFIGTQAQYRAMKDQVQEGIAIFGATLIKDGKIVVNATDTYYNNRASRTAVGITRTGKVVMMVLDGRQEPFSCGGSMEEIAQIMYDAGCVEAVNLDGGGSTTFVAKQEGDDELSVVNSPSDGYQRSVSTSLLMVSTAPSSTAFDHAILETETDYLTTGASVKITPEGVSATGNSAEIPEGAKLEVEDQFYGTIVDGVFTAAHVGSVNINLVLDGVVIGTKTLNIVYPDNVYFTNSNLNVVYGQTVELPVKVTYQGKEIAFTQNDVVFALSNEYAGKVNGFSFTAFEGTNIKSVKITAALAGDEEKNATININLFNQGEISFDFDQATGGDRILAWDRIVSNSTTADGVTYTAVDTNKDMVTSYIFALDMSQIPIPTELTDLISMLPGSDIEGASAWTFLMQLAERVGSDTTVTAMIDIDDNFDVDYSDITIVNDYFVLEAVELDPDTNVMKLTLRWIKQTAAIDPNMANPLFIVSGIKLTPKADVEWTNGTINVVNRGDISYKIYLRASALYSFAHKVDNQGIYGLYPYASATDPKDKGAWFSATYASFEDSYTLVNVVKNGWVVEDGGYAYYVDNQRLTGINLVDGYYYDFGTDGINDGQTKYTGRVIENGKTYYSNLGTLVTGWQPIGKDYYYFNEKDFTMATGKYVVRGLEYTFDENGVLVRGAFYNTGKGIQYYFAGTYATNRWIALEEGTYFAGPDGHLAKGNFGLREYTAGPLLWHHFDEETMLHTGACNGIFEADGNLYYAKNGEVTNGAVQTENGIVFCAPSGLLTVNNACYVGSSLESTAGLESGYYFCDENGYIIPNGFIEAGGYTFYMINYKRAKGFVQIGDDYYLFNSGSGLMYTDKTMWVGTNSYGIEPGSYYFQPDGKMYIPNPEGVKEIVEKDGKYYLYIDGVMQTSGLYEFDGNYYYATSSGALATGVTWVSKTNDLVAKAGYYKFEADCKMMATGFMTTPEGYTYYFDNYVILKGLTKLGDDYYFFNAGSGNMYRDADMWIGSDNPYGFEAACYYFQADGTMYIPDLENGEKAVIFENGNYYFTIDGMKQKNGLFELNGEYYYAGSTGALATDEVVWISKTNDLKPKGYYKFEADAKMMKTGFMDAPTGYTYYFKDGEILKTGLTLIDGNYYFLNTGSGRLYFDASMWVSADNAYGFQAGSYYFQADGTMYIPDLVNGKKEVIFENGNYYFTIDGFKQMNGLFELDGEFYYATSNGSLAVDKTVWVSKTNDLVPKADYYRFDSEAKLVKTGFYVDPGNGYTYYRDNLVIVKGFTKLGDNYYMFNAGSGRMYTDCNMWVGTNSYGVKPGTYYFDANGIMVF